MCVMHHYATSINLTLLNFANVKILIGFCATTVYSELKNVGEEIPDASLTIMQRSTFVTDSQFQFEIQLVHFC